jgi:hypothetical protein
MYSGRKEQIRALCAADRAFDELWADYCEIVGLLEASTTPGELLALRGKLEVEIDAALDKSS